jgi:cysteine synthase/rhodanese-related sulfurtransferase
MSDLNIFKGKSAVLDFLNPDKNIYLPLVEIPEKINPFYKEGVRIYAKLLNMLPLANVKSLPAFNMLNEAKTNGNLKEVNKLIENSSGNTVISLAVIGKIMGIDTTKAFVSHEVLSGKLQLLRLFGVEVIVNNEPICPDPADKTSGIYKAKKIGNKKEYFNAGQYENELNPGAHEKWTARQIWEQLEGDIQIFCAGLGTTGTMVGCSRFLKNKNPQIKTVGVIRTPNNPIPGVRTRGLLNMIAFDWKKHTDSFEEIGTKESFEKSLELIRNGIVVGPSSGFALSGLIKHLNSLKEQNKLDKLRNIKGEINAVFICCDSPFPYLEDYFVYLEESKFPKIENEELLLDKPKVKKKFLEENYDYEISPQEAYRLIYEKDKEVVWNSLRNGKKLNIKKGILIIDVRTKAEFEHFHLPGSKNIELQKLLTNSEKYASSLKGNKIIVVCNIGLKSNSASRLLRKEGIDSYSMHGGLTQWSNLNLPRWKPDICFKKNA